MILADGRLRIFLLYMKSVFIHYKAVFIFLCLHANHPDYPISSSHEYAKQSVILAHVALDCAGSLLALSVLLTTLPLNEERKCKR